MINAGVAAEENIKHVICPLITVSKITGTEDTEVPDHSMIKTPEQIEGIREAGKKNTMVLDFITPYVKGGSKYRRTESSYRRVYKRNRWNPSLSWLSGIPKERLHFY